MKRIPWNKGLTKETDDRVAQYAKHKIGKLNPASRKEVKEQISKTLTGRKLTKAHKNSISKGGLGTTRPKFTDSHKDKIRLATLRQHTTNPHSRFHNTKPEKRMKAILMKLGLKFVHNYPVWKIKHCYPADFYIKSLNLIIEVDGTYWHKYPDGLEIDHIRVKELEEIGYKVLRFWENHFNIKTVREALEKCV